STGRRWLVKSLLERVPSPAIDAIEHLGEMQSQALLALCVGLWPRPRDFDVHELSALTRPDAGSPGRLSRAAGAGERAGLPAFSASFWQLVHRRGQSEVGSGHA